MVHLSDLYGDRRDFRPLEDHFITEANIDAQANLAAWVDDISLANGTVHQTT